MFVNRFVTKICYQGCLQSLIVQYSVYQGLIPRLIRYQGWYQGLCYQCSLSKFVIKVCLQSLILRRVPRFDTMVWYIGFLSRDAIKACYQGLLSRFVIKRLGFIAKSRLNQYLCIRIKLYDSYLAYPTSGF